MISIAPDSGQVDRLGGFPGALALVYRSSRDDGSLHFIKVDRDQAITTRWEIASGQDTILDQSGSTQFVAMTMPDERRLIRADRHEIALKPVDGNKWQALVATPYLQHTVTSDGEWVLYHGTDSAGNHALLRAATAGGAPERLGSFPSPSYLGSMEISIDGRHIVTASYDYEHGFDLWALDNFIPVIPKR